MYISDFFLTWCFSHRKKKPVIFYLAIQSLYLEFLWKKVDLQEKKSDLWDKKQQFPFSYDKQD